MSKACENHPPTIRVRVHTPELRPVHPHLDTAFTVKKPTDFEAWAETCQRILAAMGIVQAPLVLGFVLDFVNSLPLELRQTLIGGIALGLGCEITEEEGGTVYVQQVPRYPPLVGPEERPGGLVVPGEDAGGKLVVPR